MNMHSRWLPRAARWLALLAGLLPFAAAQAQTPSVAPNPMAGEEMLGEQYCLDTPWVNAGSPGYGSYLRVILPPELSFDGATLFGSALTVVSNAVFPAAPSVLTDPLFLPATAPGNQVTGTAGWRMVVLEMPVGSVVTGGPDMTTSICVTSNNAPPNLADVGTAYPIRIAPVYRYGDTATGINGSIVGATQSPTLTPQVLRLTKDNTAPEHERPPGPAWPYDYVLAVDIANGALVTPITIADTLPANVQFVGPVTITGGAGCSATQTPSTSVPGGNVQVQCTGNTLGTTSDSDIVVRFPVYITDILDETGCGTQLLTNTATADGTYKPAGGGADVVLPQATDTSEVTAKHVAVQKGASPGQLAPGATVTYTLNFQTTQYGNTSALSVLDTLPDGINFDVGSATIAFDGGAAGGITPVYAPGINDTLTFDVRAAYGSNLPTDTAVTITYTGTVLQLYKRPGTPPILAADPLTNTVVATYDLVEGANACTDNSGATVIVDPVSIQKELLSPGSEFVPGQYVTFRLSMAIPSGDTQDVVFTDYFPLPVFDVATINTTYGGPDIYRATGAPAATADTMNLTPVVTVNPATNALILTYPNINTTAPQVVAVDVRARVMPNAFADNLFLTNIFRATSNNTDNEAAIGETPTQIHVRAPALSMTKGVLSTNGAGTIAPPPSTLPVDGNLSGADAGDQVVYRLTIENTGGAPAYDVVATDSVPAGLIGCAVTATQLSDGTPLTSSGNLFTTGLKLIRGGNPDAIVLDAAGSATDTAWVEVTCTLDATVSPTQVITNTASATWKPFDPSDPASQTFPPVADDASATIRNVAAVKSIVATSEAASTTPNVMIGEIVRYRLAVQMPEGRIADMRLFDNLPTGLEFLNDGTARIAFVSNGGGIGSSTLAGVPNVNGNAASAAATPLTFALPASAIQVGTGTLTCNPPGTFGNGTDVCFRLGDVTNADSDADAEFVVLEFNALVLNIAGNGNGTHRDNNFRVGSGTTSLATSPNVRVTTRLPSLTVGKTVTPSSGLEAGDTVTYTLTLANASGANVMPAYDVAVNDVLPAQLQLQLGTVSAVPGGGAAAFANTSAGNTVQGTVSVIPPGGSVVITYQATLLVASAPGSSIVNSVNGAWNSLPGGNGTAPNPTGSTTPGATGANNGEREFTGTAQAPITVTPVTLGKVVHSTSLGYTGDGQVRAGAPDLAIGEVATFRITATIPEGTAPQVLITDTVPYSNGRMEVLSGAVVSIGSGMTIATPSPVPAISDAQLGDGINDTISFNFGAVSNPIGNNTPTPQTIVVEVVARLIDHADNANGDQLTNNALVQFGPGLNGSASAEVDVVEPLLDIQKSSPTTTGQAGDVVTFTLNVAHAAASAMEAQALRIQDTLPTPAGLNNLTAVTVTPTCATSPAPSVANNSTATALDIVIATLPLDCSLTITYQATLMADVVVNTSVINTASLSWHSIDPGVDPNGRDHSDSDTHEVLISSPGMSKWVQSVSPGIGSAQVDPSLHDLAIGAEVTWQFDVEFPAGDSLNAVVADQLPVNTVSMNVVSSRIVSVGAGISGIAPTSTPVAGAAGASSDGADADSHADLVTWSLGNLRAAPVAAANRTIRFEVVARVMDTPQTAGGVTVRNTASFTASTISTPISASSDVDIVEPRLTLSKVIALINGAAPDPARIVQAGDVVSFQITVAHQAAAPASTADAFNVTVTDTLPNPGLGSVTNVGGSCGVTSGSGYPTVSFTVGTLALGNTCTITYDTVVTNTVNPGQTYVNDAVATYTSMTNPLAPGGRTGTTNHDSDNVTVLGPSLVKLVASTSLGDTGSGQHGATVPDLAIGETVTYTLTIGFPQGTTTTAVLVDSLPAGLEAIGASVDALGNTGIGTSLPGTPVLSNSGVGYNDTVTFDFGTIANPANGVLTDDWIRVLVTARVRDLPANVDALLLTNHATFSNGTTPDVDDQADVELVEPALALVKTMTPGAGPGTALITLTITNNGTGPAYNVLLQDVLSHAVWLDSSIVVGTTPTGFTGALDTSVAGQTTVNFTSNTGVGLLPGATATATIHASLAVFPPSPNPVLNQAEIPGYGSVPEDPANPDIRIHAPVQDDDSLGFPGPVVTKTVANTGSGAGGAFVPGDVVIFHVIVRNIGVVALNSVTLTDTVPGNTTFDAAASHAGWTGCADGAPAGTICTLGTFSVAAGATETRAFAVQIDSPLPASVTQVMNQAVMSSPDVPMPIPSDDPTTPADPDDPTDVPVLAAPDLVLTKVDDVPGGNVVAPGDTIVYTLSYQNVGNQNASGVVLTETVPANTTLNAAASTAGWVCAPNGNAGSTCTLAIGNVAAGAAAASVNFAVTIVDPVPAGTSSILNTARVADDGSNGPDPTPIDNEDSETTPLLGTPGLHLTKTDGDVTTVPGGVVVYTLRYWNDGDTDVANGVISETVPANSTFVPGSSTAGWTCTPNNGAGSTCTLAVGTLVGHTVPAAAGTALFAVQVDNPLAAGVTAINNAAVLGGDGVPSTPPAQDDTPVSATPDMAITKTAGSSSVGAGDVLVYTLSYANVGNQHATGVVITETVPANTTFNAGASAAGWSCANGAPAGSLCTFAVAGVVPAGAAPASVLFAVNIPSPVPAGFESVFNAVSIADDGSNGTDPDPTNNQDDVTTPVNAVPQLRVTKDDGGATVQPGDAITYTISYQNTGDQNAAGVVLTEVVPAHTTYTGSGWTCTPGANAGSTCTLAVGALAAGASGTASFVVTVDDPIAAGVAEIHNRVTIVSDGSGGEPSTPPNPADPGDPRQDEEPTPVNAAPDLAIQKTSASTARPGDVVVYDLAYANVGNQGATGVVISETVPAHASFVAASSSPGWSCADGAPAGTACTLAISGTVPGGQSLPPGTVVQFAVRVVDPLPAGVADLTNQVHVGDDGSNGPDPTPIDNDDEDIRPIVAAPDLQIVKRVESAAAMQGGQVRYGLTYRNVGDQDANGVVITETVPAGTTFVAAASTAGWSCADGSPGGTTCTLAVGSVAADGASHVVYFAVRIEIDHGNIDNAVSIEDENGIGSDPTPTDNEDEVSIAIAPRFIPVDAPWALLLMLLAMLGLGWMQRERMR